MPVGPNLNNQGVIEILLGRGVHPPSKGSVSGTYFLQLFVLLLALARLITDVPALFAV
jgi:hypothetical protein